MMSDANALFNQGRFREAEIQARLQLEQNPNDAGALNVAGALAGRRLRWKDAIDLFGRAVAADPGDPNLLCNFGIAQRTFGEFDAARELYRRALRIKPDCARAYFQLSQITRGESDELLSPIVKLLRERQLGDDDRSFLHFAAGKFYDDLADWSRAFLHFQLGNVARRLPYDPIGFVRLVDRIIAVFTPARQRSLRELGHASNRPIFIVGMPRSGTTLVEQILTGNPGVFAAGELRDISEIATAFTQHDPQRRGYPENVVGVNPGAFAGFAESYLKRLDEFDTSGHPHVVNKNPINIFYVGLIQAMFPNAAILHCRREPVSTCMSCYCQRFTDGQEYSCDLTHLGMRYRQYERIVAHWKESLPAPIHEVVYEELVQEPARVIRGILEFCGLEWDERCTKPHERDGAVSTASSWQVRQPIGSGKLNRYRGYEPYLGPLRNALEVAGL